ncbi:hypothetical protein Tco_0622520 [Tanacetum coccineum]
MDDPNITMKEYIRLEEEKAQKHSKVFNWETGKYGKIWYNEDIHDLRSVETEFPAIAFNDKVSSEKTLSCEPTVSSLNDEIDFRISFDDSDDEDYMVIFDKNSFSYKIISTNDLKTDSKNDNEKGNLPSLPSPEPTVNCLDDLDFFNGFEKEFLAIIYNDALTSKSDFLTEPTISIQHIDEFNLKDETSLSECDEEEQNVLNFNDLFPFNVIYPNDSKSDKDNDDDKVDIEHSSGDLSVKPLPDVINIDVGAYAHGSNKLLETNGRPRELTVAEGTEGPLNLGPERPRVYSDLSQDEKDRNLGLVKMLLEGSELNKGKTMNTTLVDKTCFDEDVDEQPVQDLALNVDNVFQADDCDAYDSDVDDVPRHKFVYSMANIYLQILFMMKRSYYDSESYLRKSGTVEVGARFELTEREQKIDEQLRIVICDRNLKEENLKKELHSVKLQLASTIQHNNLMVDEGIVRDCEETLEQAKISRKRMHDKMKTKQCVDNKVNITPPNYSKENFFATFTPQKQLTPEQLFWSQDIVKMKAEALKVQNTRPIKALSNLSKRVKMELHQRGSLKGIGVLNNPRMLPSEVIPFFKTLQEHFEGIQKALTKEVKEMSDAFDELEAELDQSIIDRKHDAIERKNLLLEHDNIIVDCLFKEVFYVASNSKLNVSRFTEMQKAHHVVKARCLELEAELSNLRDDVRKNNYNDLLNQFSNLEANHLNLQLKYQNLKDSFQNKPSSSVNDTPDFNSVFVIGQMNASLQGKDNVIQRLKMQISQLKETRSELDQTIDFRARDFQISQLTEKVNSLQEQNELFRVENAKIKQHYKELYDSIKIRDVKPNVLAPGKYAIDVEHIPPRNRNNREVHLVYLRHLKEIVDTLREIVEEAKVERPLDRSLAFACRYTKHSQELLVYVFVHMSKAPGDSLRDIGSLPANSESLKNVETTVGYLDQSEQSTYRVDSQSFSYKAILGNDTLVLLMGYGDYHVTSDSVIPGLLVVGLAQLVFCRSICDLVPGSCFQKHSYMMKSSQFAYYQASKNKSWLWHRLFKPLELRFNIGETHTDPTNPLIPYEHIGNGLTLSYDTHWEPKTVATRNRLLRMLSGVSTIPVLSKVETGKYFQSELLKETARFKPCKRNHDLIDGRHGNSTTSRRALIIALKWIYKKEGLDFGIIFASVARLEAIRIFIAMRQQRNDVYQMDVKTAS